MGKSLFISAGLVLALAACGKSAPAGGNGATAANGNGAAAASSVSSSSVSSSSGVKTVALQIQPGEWEVTEETLNASGTGPTAAYLSRMKGHVRTSRECITPEEASKPVAFSQNHDDQCDYSHFTFGGGTIKGTISCNDKGGNGSVTMTMDGHYSAQAYDMNTSMDMNMHGMSTKIDSRRTAHRVGECSAGGKDSE
jgi:hypothetical protein